MLKNLNESNPKVSMSPEAIDARFRRMAGLFVAGRYFIKRLKPVDSQKTSSSTGSSEELKRIEKR